MMSDLYTAIKIANEAHKGQVDKAGDPYILHVLRVTANVASVYDVETCIVAILHDVVEDTPITYEDLTRHGFSDDVVEAVGYLTRTEGTTYMDYIQLIKNNELAHRVKLEDLEDHLDIDRVRNISASLEQRYRKAYQSLYQ